MIVYELRCSAAHGFEAWFRNSDAYDQQRAQRQVSCPICGDSEISKAPMAPRINRGVGGHSPAPAMVEAGRDDQTAAQLSPAAVEHMRAVMSKIAELNRRIAETCEYVGDAFPEEARKIHYGETEHREIYGDATPEQAAELREEGVAVAAIPWIRRTDG